MVYFISLFGPVLVKLLLDIIPGHKPYRMELQLFLFCCIMLSFFQKAKKLWPVYAACVLGMLAAYGVEFIGGLGEFLCGETCMGPVNRMSLPLFCR